jgi:integrase
VKIQPWFRPTRTRYEQLFRLYVLPTIGGLRVRALRPGDVQRVLDVVSSQRSSRTTLHVFRVLSEVLGEAERWGIAPSVAKSLPATRPKQPDLTIPTPDETRAILAVMTGSIAEGPAVLATGCGLRLGEALALRWDDVVLERARIGILGTMYRGGRTEQRPRARRTVALPGFAISWLKDLDRRRRRVASRR